MTRSSAPEYKRDGYVWQCWITDENTYLWKTTDGTLEVGRAGKEFWARVRGKLSSMTWPRLIGAMAAAAAYSKRAAA